jgi:hypothetical protein
MQNGLGLASHFTLAALGADRTVETALGLSPGCFLIEAQGNLLKTGDSLPDRQGRHGLTRAASQLLYFFSAQFGKRIGQLLLFSRMAFKKLLAFQVTLNGQGCTVSGGDGFDDRAPAPGRITGGKDAWPIGSQGVGVDS